MKPDTTALASPPSGQQATSSELLDAHNYHDWAFDRIRPFVEDGRIQDSGSGTANQLCHLSDREVVSVDLAAGRKPLAGRPAT